MKTQRSDRTPPPRAGRHTSGTALGDRWQAIEYPTALQRSRRIHPQRKGLRNDLLACSESRERRGGLPSGQPRQRKVSPLRVIEAAVLAVWCLAGLSAAEVSGRHTFSVAFVGEQLDELCFMLDLLVQDTRRQIVCSRVLSKRDVAYCTPASYRATF